MDKYGFDASDRTVIARQFALGTNYSRSALLITLVGLKESPAVERSILSSRLLDVDPIGIVRNRRRPSRESGTLAQYVNDYPYIASSFP